MKAFENYWTCAAIRGVATLLAAAAIVAVPIAASDMLSIPFVLALGINCYAAYTVFDAAVMILLAKLLPAQASGRKALYPQAALAVLFSAALFLITIHILPLSMLFWVAAAQAAIAAISEFFVARSTHVQYGCLSCYSSVFALAFSAFALPFGALLSPENMTLALAAYLTLFGTSEISLGARMLFLDYRADHPAPQFLSEDWRAAMDPAPQPVPAAHTIDCMTSINCEDCPADPICRDNTLKGKLTSLLTSRQPAIVKAIRAAALLQQR